MKIITFLCRVDERRPMRYNNRKNGIKEENQMITKEEITQFIKDEVKSNNSHAFYREPIVGFAAADDELFKGIKEIVGTHHILPQEILPEAATVVSYFIPFSETLIESNRGSEVSEEWAQAYIECNCLINATCEKLIEELGKKSVKAGAMKATDGYDETLLMAVWSHRSAAYIAGLGKFGRNRMLITEKGGAGRYGSLVISQPLQPDLRTDKEFCLSHSGKECSFCVNNCPVGAVTPDGFDRHKCNKQLALSSARFSHLGHCDVCGKCAVGPCAICR